jgi:GWxTD domain-containing protein
MSRVKTGCIMAACSVTAAVFGAGTLERGVELHFPPIQAPRVPAPSPSAIAAPNVPKPKSGPKAGRVLLAQPQTRPVQPAAPAQVPETWPRMLVAQAPSPAQTARPAEPPVAARYQRWLNEEVVYIITDEERRAFRSLTTDEEREKFIEQFWLRRDPTPGTPRNEFREEHYRRIAYANRAFDAGTVPGWKTDRGMIYVKFGPPAEREQHPNGGTYDRPIEEGGGVTTVFPFEKWRYDFIEGIGSNIVIEFVDTTGKGEYHMTTDPEEKDALLYVAGAGLTLFEELGLAKKSDRFTRTDGTHLGTGTMPLPDNTICSHNSSANPLGYMCGH